VEMISG